MAISLGSVLPWTGGQFFDNNGDPLAAGKVFFYLSGTSTKTDTWSDSDMVTANANPVILNSSGRATIFLDTEFAYTIVVATSTADDPPVGAQIIRTIDGVSASLSITNITIPIVAGESITAGQWIYLSKGDSGTTAGRWYLTDADSPETSSTAVQIAISNDTLTVSQSGTAFLSGRYVLAAGTGFTAGTYYYLSGTAGEITATIPTTYRRIAGQADTTSSLIVSGWQGVGVAPSFSATPTVDASNPAVVSGTLEVNTTGWSFVTGAGGGDFYINPIQENVMNINGRTLRLKFWGTFANNSNAKSVALIIGTVTTIVSSTSQTFQNKRWTIEALIIRTSSTAATAIGEFRPSAPDATYAIVQTISTPAYTAANEKEIFVQATGVANADVTMTGAIVEILN